ncbi:MAG: hypothetical protein ABJA35_02915 [Parafilimonas sp.]
MKKIIASLIFASSLLISQKSDAQLEKGNVLVGGDIADFNLGLNKNSDFRMTINPTAAWFIQNNVAVGAYLNLGVDAVKGATATSYGVGALGRYYLGTDKVNTETFLKHTRAFIEANVGVEGNNVSHGASTNGLGIGFGPGLAYFITPNIGLETLLKYQGIVGFGNAPLNSRLDLNVGFQIYLPGKATQRKVMKDAQ